MTLTDNSLNVNFVTAIKDEMNSDWTYCGVGTGTGAESASGTALGEEYYRRARQETTTTSDSRTISTWFPSTVANGSTVGEIGIFDSSSVDSGSMWVRHKLNDTIEKTSNIEMWFDVKVTTTCTES